MTGFIDIFDLISFGLIVCGGDIDMMTKKFCKLSWLEEWVLYFEFAYGRTHVRLNDYRKRWNIRVKTIRKVLKRKLSLIIRMRNIWPRYASLEEDRVFRNPDTWAEILSEDIRLVMHDMSLVMQSLIEQHTIHTMEGLVVKVVFLHSRVVGKEHLSYGQGVLVIVIMFVRLRY